MSQTLENGWKFYQQKVIPKTAAPVQIMESRRAFYAGASEAMFRITEFLHAGNSDGLHEIIKECIQFHMMVKKGEA